MESLVRLILFVILIVSVQCISLDENTDKDLISRLAEYAESADCDDPEREKTSEENTGLAFSCKIYKSDEVPTSVHELRASDIKVVAAIGDEMTTGAAAGSDSITETLTEYRGFSFSAGGEETVKTMSTLPNILKKFSPDLKGFSTNTRIGLNVAEAGATINDLTCQAAELIDMMKADTSIDYENDWKVVTIFMGSNDICNACQYTDDSSSPSDLMVSMYEALDMLMDEMPRVLVNVVSNINAYVLNAMSDQGPTCSTVYMQACPCVAAGDKVLEHVNADINEYQELVDNLISSGRYEKQDFAVVVQPFLEQQAEDKTVDMSLMASDCINLSKKGQAIYGLALYHSMFIGVNSKKTNLVSAIIPNTFSLDGEEVPCPTENQFFATNTNSGSGQMSGNAFEINAVDDDSSSSTNGAVIAVSIIGGCLCMIAIIGGLVAYRRSAQRRGYTQPEGHPMLSSSGYTKFS